MSILVTRFALGNEADLTTPTSTMDYKLGEVVALSTSAASVSKYIYVRAHAALTQYQPYVLDWTTTANEDLATGAPATLAAPGRLVVIPQVAFTDNYYGWVLVEGQGSVLMTAETYADGDHLQLLNAGTALVVDGTTGSTAVTVNSCAMCYAAGTTAVAKACYLFGRQAVIAAT